jgi:hypothetical protein
VTVAVFVAVVDVVTVGVIVLERVTRAEEVCVMVPDLVFEAVLLGVLVLEAVLEGVTVLLGVCDGVTDGVTGGVCVLVTV